MGLVRHSVHDALSRVLYNGTAQHVRGLGRGSGGGEREVTATNTTAIRGAVHIAGSGARESEGVVEMC